MNKIIDIENYGTWEIRPDINRIGHKGIWIKEKDVTKLIKTIKQIINASNTSTYKEVSKKWFDLNDIFEFEKWLSKKAKL